MQRKTSNMEQAFKIWADMIHGKLPKERAGQQLSLLFLTEFFHSSMWANIGDSEMCSSSANTKAALPHPYDAQKQLGYCQVRLNVSKKMYTAEEYATWEQLAIKYRRFPPEDRTQHSADFRGPIH